MKPLPLAIAPGLRFTCHGCGECCREFTVALEEGEADRIARHDWRREGPRFAAGFTKPGTNARGEPRDELLKAEGGACVFLDADGLCLVEKRLGREAKPKTCRKFPFEFVAAPDGRRVVVSVECGSRWRSLDDGAPVEALRDELAAIDARSEPYRLRWSVQVSAPRGRFLTGTEYGALERALAAELREDRPILDTLAGLAAHVAPSAEGPAGLARALEAVAEAGARPAAARAARDLLADAREPGNAVEAAGRALAAAASEPAGRRFVLAVLESWLDAAIPGRNPSAEDGVGQMALGAIVLAAIVRAPDPARLNRAAREASLLFRGRESLPLRERVGSYAGVARSLRKG